MKISLLVLIILLAGCDPNAQTVVQGNRHLESSTVGKLADGSGDSRIFYVLHDKDTGVDYLAVIDAGIIELKPLPTPPIESAK